MKLKKYYRCPKCLWVVKKDVFESYKKDVFESYTFSFSCPRCGTGSNHFEYVNKDKQND